MQNIWDKAFTLFFLSKMRESQFISNKMLNVPQIFQQLALRQNYNTVSLPLCRMHTMQDYLTS